MKLNILSDLVHLIIFVQLSSSNIKICLLIKETTIIYKKFEIAIIKSKAPNLLCVKNSFKFLYNVSFIL